eukprot:6205225-Pleurochrysis_carterae.AAC.2
MPAHASLCVAAQLLAPPCWSACPLSSAALQSAVVQDVRKKLHCEPHVQRQDSKSKRAYPKAHRMK